MAAGRRARLDDRPMRLTAAVTRATDDGPAPVSRPRRRRPTSRLRRAARRIAVPSASAARRRPPPPATPPRHYPGHHGCPARSRSRAPRPPRGGGRGHRSVGRRRSNEQLPTQAANQRVGSVVFAAGWQRTTKNLIVGFVEGVYVPKPPWLPHLPRAARPPVFSGLTSLRNVHEDVHIGPSVGARDAHPQGRGDCPIEPHGEPESGKGRSRFSTTSENPKTARRLWRLGTDCNGWRDCLQPCPVGEADEETIDRNSSWLMASDTPPGRKNRTR